MAIVNQPLQGGLGGQSPAPSSPGFDMSWVRSLGQPGSFPAGQHSGNLSASGVSPEEMLLDQLFRGSATGQGGGPIASMLFNLGQGNLPQPITDMITGQTNEQFGKMGARFGTDLATAISRGLGQASAGQSMNAIDRIMNLGGTTAGFQFQRGENSQQRALQEYLQRSQNDLTMQLIPLLLGGGVG